MRRKVVLSAILAAGLVQVAPAVAQTQEAQPEQDKAPVTAPAPAPTEAKPVEPAPVAEAKAPVMDRARELAEKDLAVAPPEEMKPVLVDPGDARRALARARQAAAEAEEARAVAERPVVEQAPRAAVAEARAPEPRPEIAEPRPAVAAAEPAPPVREARAIYADDDRGPGYRGEEAVAPRDDREERDVYADAGDDAPESAQPRDIRGRQARQVYADDVEDAPRDLRGRQARQVYADDEPAAPAARDVPPARAQRPVYAEDDRDADAGYPAGRGVPAGDIYDRVPRPGARYAIIDRSLRPDAGRGDDADQQWGARQANPICDGGRADRLLRAVRRKADFERIDGRAAEDLEDEIGNAANLQQSYCASGMNDWREQRLDRLYAQIEDRIRYEEDRRWRR